MSDTLGKALEKLSCENVKVGSNNGSSFFYCSYLESAIEEIAKISKSFKRKIKTNYKRYKYRLDNFETIWEERFEKTKRILDKKWQQHLYDKCRSDADRRRKKAEIDKRIKEYPHTIAKLERLKERQKITLPKVVDRLKKQLDTFVPLLDRDVVEIYDSISENNTKIVIIKGKEQGNYWTINEYECPELKGTWEYGRISKRENNPNKK